MEVYLLCLFFALLLEVPLLFHEDVDGEDHGAGSHFGGLVVQELLIIH